MVQIDDLGKVIRQQFGSKVKAVYVRADTHSLQVFPGAYVSEDAM